ncbi:MAG: hypothetical protein JOY60_06130 [Burkholderiaceae bacterium]|nr:hypothetical protein [Burkholderiaceae bacterium]
MKNLSLVSRAAWCQRLACTAVALLAASPAWSAELLISFQPLPNGEVELSYTPPEGMRELPFFQESPNAHSVWRFMQMRAASPCATLGEHGIQLRDTPSCTTAVFHLRPHEISRFGLAEPVQATGDGRGAVVYSGQFAVLLPGTDLHWRWLPAAGAGAYVMRQGQVSTQTLDVRVPAQQVDQALKDGTKADLGALGAAEYVLMARAPVQTIEGLPVMLDPGLDAGVAERIRHALGTDLASLQRLYGTPLKGPHAVIALASALPGMRADVAADTLRLSVARLPESLPNELLEQTVARDLARWWTSEVFRADPDRSWLQEGHADWMALLLLAQDGRWGGKGLSDRMAYTVNQCLRGRGEEVAALRPAHRQVDDDALSCGMSLMMLGQARIQARAQPAVPPALRVMAGLYKDHPTLDVAGFARWADGAETGPVHKLLLDTRTGFAEEFARQLGELQLAQARTTTATLPKLMGALMQSDCDGKQGFFARPQSFKLEKREDLQCKTLLTGEEVTRIAGASLSSDALSIWQAVDRACQPSLGGGALLVLDYRNGENSSMSCPKALQDPQLRLEYQFSPDALQRLGLSAAAKS